MRIRFLILGLLLTLAAPSRAAATGTAFTYQGRLNDGTQPANGFYDLRFNVFDTATGSGIVSSLITNAATLVSNGLFTVTLDFGADVFDGRDRWLQIGVRTNGSGAFVALLPRHPLTPTPYAVYAPNAGLAASASSVPSRTITSAMLADGAVTSNKINASVLSALKIGDDGSAAYAELMTAGRGLQTADPLPFSELSLIVSNSGAAPALAFRLNGALFGKALAFSGHEGISELYEYVVEVVGTSSLTPDSAIGQSGVLTFTRNGRSTVFAGIVTGCTRASYQGETLFTFRLAPSLAYLDLFADYRLFQDKSAPDIVQALFLEITGESAVNSLSGSYRQRPLTIQFAETDRNFFNRLLEDEGAFYFFRTEAASTTLILGDGATSLIDSGIGTLGYNGNNPTNPPSAGTEYLRVFQKAARDSTRTAELNGYDFTAPRKDLRATRTGSGARGEAYEFNGTVTQKGDMEALARVQVERVDTERNLTRGAGNVPDLRPGYTFMVNDSSGAGLSGEYVVTSVRHAAFRRTTTNATSFYYGNQFEALPATLAYRPARKTPKPVAPACTAVVTGKAGEEIWTDQYGRVKVQFHWDRRGTSDERSSGWIRVATQLAGKMWGTFSVPRIGQEVLVEFVNGDPDQPVITGSLYNGDNMPPYALPAEATKSGIKTRSSKGGTTANYNEIRFEDKKGAEELYIKAEKDLNLDVNHDTTIGMGNDLTWLVAGTMSLHGIHDMHVTADNGLLVTSGQGVGINAPNDPAMALNAGGPIAASAFHGSGSGLTNVPASALTGILSEDQLPDGVIHPSQDVVFCRSVTARVFIGSGAGLTNLFATNLTGTISDARLSANVAKLNSSPTFTGTVTANLFRGNGAALTNLATTNLTGTVSDTLLSPNIARLNTSQLFTGNASFAGNVGIGTSSPEDARLDVEGDMHLNDYDLFLRAGSDRNHGLGWYGEGKLFAGVNLDGPVLYGCDGGGLGTACNSSLALRWRNDGNVMIDPNSLNTGSLLPGLTFGSFSGEGISSKRTVGINQYGLDFYTYGTNRLSITQSGRVGLGTTTPQMALDIFDGSGTAHTGGNLHLGAAAASADPKLIHFGDLQTNGLGYVYVGERGSDDTLELRAARFYFNTGNVGVGVANATAASEVNGTARATRFECDAPSLTNLSTVRTWQIVTNAVIATVANRGYLANSATQIRFELPTSGVLGDIVRVAGLGAGGWMVRGTAMGDISGTALQSLELLCVTNGHWRAVGRF